MMDVVIVAVVVVSGVGVTLRQTAVAVIDGDGVVEQSGSVGGGRQRARGRHGSR